MKRPVTAGFALLLAACGGSTPVAAPAASLGAAPTVTSSSATAPPAAPIATVAPTPTVAPATLAPVASATDIATVAPTPTASPTPVHTLKPQPTAGEGVVERVGDPILKVWTTSGMVQAQVIQEVRNTGTGWARVTTGDYTIYEKDGSVAGTGSFGYAYPALLGPGETGWLFDTAYLEGVKRADVATAEVTARYDTTDDPGPQLEITNLKYKVEPYGDGALQASGVVKNLTEELASSITIGVLFFDGDGNVLGGAYTNIVQNVEPGTKKGFETIIGSPPIKRSAVKSVKAFGTIQDY